MKKFLISLVCVVFMSFAFAGCSTADDIEEGKYVCKTPYIEYSFYSDIDHVQLGKIEVEGTIYDAFLTTGYDAVITFYEYQEAELKPVDGWYLGDNEVYGKFKYRVNDRTNQLILTDEETGNVYHLDKIE